MKSSRLFFLVLLATFSNQLAAETIALISDMNGRYGSATYSNRVGHAIAAIVEMQPDLVISAGDMVAGQKQPLLDSDRLDQMWAGFNLTVADPLSRAGIPFAVTPGNHDGSAFARFALEQQHFQKQWASRVPEIDILPGSEWPRRYAARIGAVLLLAFDGTRPGKLPQGERLFIENMLSAYGKGPDLTIVFSHLPMWPLGRGRESEIIDDPQLLALLHAHGVDVYASGHHHVFFAGTDERGMIHLGIGALGGNARMHSVKRSPQSFSFTILSMDQREITIESRMAPGFQNEIPLENLPATIKGSLGTLRRVEGPVPLRDSD